MYKRNRRHRLLAAITVLVLVLTMLVSGISVFALGGTDAENTVGQDPSAAELTNGSGTDDVTDTETGKTDGGKEKEDAKAPEDNGNDADTAKPAEKPEEAVKDKPAETKIDAKGGDVSAAEQKTVNNWGQLKEEVEKSDGATVITVESSGPDNPNFIRVQLINGVTNSITVRRPVTIKGYYENGKGTTIYQPINAATAVKEYKPMFIVENGGNLTLGENLTLSGQMAQNANKVTKGQFSGSAGSEKGFFVEVNGGTFHLNGATLRDITAGEWVEYAAPVVSHGGTVNINSGAITHNTIGYAADNNKSGEKSFTIGFESERGNFEEQPDTLVKQWRNTETAGAMILTDGSSCEISGGTIDQNRGDTGAIVLQGLPDKQKGTLKPANDKYSNLYINGGKIDSNAGVHHAGAIYVFNGAHCQMDDGTVSYNFAWMKGGAFWITEEAYASQTVSKFMPKDDEVRSVPTADAAFVLKGGSINNNMAVKRGGAIQVQSNHVALCGGKIESNICRELGGGVYLEGDPGRPFQMYVPQGVITNNKATAVQGNDGGRLRSIFYKESNSRNGLVNDINFINNICTEKQQCQGDPTGNANNPGFWGDRGDGGGLWLCAFGGTATFDVKDNGHEVIITGNKLSAVSRFGGTDVFVRHTGTEAGNGIYVYELGENNHFINEDDNGEIPIHAHKHYNGPLKLRNKNTAVSESHPGVRISNNVASCGGGIAANGNVIFGEAENVYRGGAVIRVTKKWTEAVTSKEAVTLKLYVLIDGKELPADNLLKDGYEVTLNGKADEFVEELTGDGEDQYTEETPAYEIEPWVAEGALPLTIIDPDKDGEEKTYPLFTFDYKNTPGDKSDDLDPTKEEDLRRIYELLEKGELTAKNARPTNWRLVVEEIAPDGSVSATRLLDSNDPELTAFKTEKTVDESGNAIKYVDKDNNMIGQAETFTIGMEFAKDVTNDLNPAAEKYADKQKHTSMSADEVLTYDILAYVPLDAQEFTLTDELSAPLEFCDSRGDKTTNPSKTIQSISYRQTNDHRENGSVAARPDGTVSMNDVSANISGQKLTVHLDKGKTLDKLRGKWVQLTFTANIKPRYRDSNDVLNNGVTNQAVYHVSYGSAHKSEDSVKTDVVSSEVKKASGKKAADTGDHTDAGLWFALMAASAGGIMVLTLRRRRRV